MPRRRPGDSGPHRWTLPSTWLWAKDHASQYWQNKDIGKMQQKRKGQLSTTPSLEKCALPIPRRHIQDKIPLSSPRINVK